MTRTTIALPDELARVVAREARRRGSSVSALAREALADHLGLAGGKRPPFAALGRSGHRHTARDAEKILSGEWGRVRHR